ncbi:HamA C-terminal domain-containing protein [Pediococcus acidilactici]|uniref:DUF1837 domain-containing protein n=1 Tax=Pediococcus acidilactici TaxID=1254 RepID=A0AAW8YH38_PEDAC|nr:DUF1837 domain-containing protein [Pediococcus acidilactici]MDV2621542.1 DUF1837 domain-containing protein [Pediococcus acidilactici]
MAEEANFTYLIDLVNPYLPDAEDTSKEETVRLIIKQASNNQYLPMPASSTLNKYAADGISRSASKKLLKFLNKETSSLEEYFSKIGPDQLTLIANKLKKDGISLDVYRGKVPALLAKLFTEECERVASRKNKRKQKILTKSEDEYVFTKTVSDEMFSTVFQQVNTSELDVVKNRNAIHAFALKPELLPFSYANLKNLVISNITNYAIARGISKTDIVGLQAASLLRKYAKSGIPDNLLGELLVYIFLEHEDHALKLYTRAEILKNRRTIDSEGMYLKRDQGKTQLILGVSQLSNNLENAISNVVEKIANFDNNQSNEMVLANDIVDRSIIYTQFGESKSKAIIKLMAPTETDFEGIASYGLFIGYKFRTKLDLDNCTQEKAKERCRQVISRDLKQAISELNIAIQQHHWQKSSFYVYLLPFTNAEEDSLAIMKDLIGE